jgi:hypothetical protein
MRCFSALLRSQADQRGTGRYFWLADANPLAAAMAMGSLRAPIGGE